MKKSCTLILLFAISLYFLFLGSSFFNDIKHIKEEITLIGKEISETEGMESNDEMGEKSQLYSMTNKMNVHAIHSPECQYKSKNIGLLFLFDQFTPNPLIIPPEVLKI